MILVLGTPKPMTQKTSTLSFKSKSENGETKSGNSTYDMIKLVDESISHFNED